MSRHTDARPDARPDDFGHDGHDVRVNTWRSFDGSAETSVSVECHTCGRELGYFPRVLAVAAPDGRTMFVSPSDVDRDETIVSDTVVPVLP